MTMEPPIYLDKTAGVTEDDGTCMKGAADDGLAANVAQIDAWWCVGCVGIPPMVDRWMEGDWVGAIRSTGNYYINII